MKIYFDNVDMSSRSGPNSFAKRLAKALANRGHILADPDDYDVAIVFIEQSPRLDTSKPFVQRLDGIWFKPDEFSVKNVGIKRTYDAATAVVFQSEFNRKQVTGWWGEHKYDAVIHNGIDPLEIRTALTQQQQVSLQNLRNDFDKLFVCSSNWHPQKRLKANVEFFQHLKRTKFPNAGLLILGNNADAAALRSVDRYIKPSIFYAGSISHEACLQVYSQADYMIHLAWLDHSPNTVVESLGCGCPVIHTSDGGTRELVGVNGILLQEQVAYDYTLRDYDNPPDIIVEQDIVWKDFDSAQRYAMGSIVDIKYVVEAYEDILSYALKNR